MRKNSNLTESVFDGENKIPKPYDKYFEIMDYEPCPEEGDYNIGEVIDNNYKVLAYLEPTIEYEDELDIWPMLFLELKTNKLIVGEVSHDRIYPVEMDDYLTESVFSKMNRINDDLSIRSGTKILGEGVMPERKRFINKNISNGKSKRNLLTKIKNAHPELFTEDLDNLSTYWTAASLRKEIVELLHSVDFSKFAMFDAVLYGKDYVPTRYESGEWPNVRKVSKNSDGSYNVYVFLGWDYGCYTEGTGCAKSSTELKKNIVEPLYKLVEKTLLDKHSDWSCKLVTSWGSRGVTWTNYLARISVPATAEN